MTDHPASDIRARPLPLGRFVLARTDRLDRTGGRKLAREVTVRHDPQRLAVA
jgi:hypothetical protein